MEFKSNFDGSAISLMRTFWNDELGRVTKPALHVDHMFKAKKKAIGFLVALPTGRVHKYIVITVIKPTSYYKEGEGQ